MAELKGKKRLGAMKKEKLISVIRSESMTGEKLNLVIIMRRVENKTQ